MQLCFATNNAHKLEELQHLIGDKIDLLSLQGIGCTDEIPETGNTLQANALEKASYVQTKFAINCFADDTGLEVDVLEGAPGVYSARYAGEPANSDKNIELLLKNLKGIQNRTARFRTVIALLIDDKEPIYFEGVVEGHIAEKSSGKGGFGYDSVFIPNGVSCTFAMMSAKDKNSISHRGKAVEKLVRFLTI